MPQLAIACVMRDEEQYIAEWIGFHILQGVDKFVIYDNDSKDDSAAIARKFCESVDVQVIDWPLRDGHFDAHQRAAYKDASIRLSGTADFVAFIDIDEFLYDVTGAPLPDYFERFEFDVDAVAVQQITFGSSGHLTQTLGPVVTRFTKSNSKENPERFWFKTVARPERVLQVNSCHSVRTQAGTYVLTDGDSFDMDRPGRATRLSTGNLVLNHYIIKSLEEYRKKQEKWLDRTQFNSRYDDGYFFYRDQVSNIVEDITAASWATKLIALLEKHGL